MKYHKVFLLSSSIIILSLILVTLDSHNKIASAVDFLTYENAVLGIKILYPSDTNPEEDLSIGWMNFETPLSGHPLDEFNIQVQDFAQPKTLRTYAIEILKEESYRDLD